MGGYKDFGAEQATNSDPAENEVGSDHFSATVSAAFAWAKANNVRVINFETIETPPVPVNGDTQVTAFSAITGQPFVRVWYMEL